MATHVSLNEIISSLLQPAFVLNSHYEVVSQSIKGKELSGHDQPLFNITDVIVLKQDEKSDDLSLIQLLDECVTTGKNIVRPDCVIFSTGQPVPLMADISMQAFLSDNNETQVLLQINIIDSDKKAQQDALLNSSDDLIWSVGPDFHVLFCNDAFSNGTRKITGTAVFQGDNALYAASYKGDQHVAKWKNYYERAFSGERFSVKEETLSESGQLLFCSFISLTPLTDREGKLWGAACFAKDITAQTLASKALEKANFELQNILSSSVDIICTINASGEFVNINEACLPVWGYRPDELQHVNFNEIIHPDDSEKTKAEAAGLMMGKDVTNFENRYIKKDGSVVYMIWSARWDPGTELMYCVGKDVTEREHNLQRIKESERKLLSAQQLLKLGNWQLNLKTFLFDWSDEVYNIWGVSKEHFIPTLDVLYTTIHPDDRNLFIAEQEAAISGIKDIDIECRVILPDGTVKWVHNKGRRITGVSGAANFLEGSVQDITVEKLLSLSLEESNQRYHYATQATFDAIWDWDIVKNTIYRGENYQYLFGYSAEELIASSDSWVDHIHPDYREMIASSIHNALESTQSKWSGEYKYEQHDGTYAYVIDRGIIVRDRNGRAIRMVGAMQDISKQKEEESRLKLLESVITNTNDAVVITDAENTDPRIIYVNEAFTRMTGYLPDEIIGQSPKMLQGPLSDFDELKKLGDAIRRKIPYEITTINYRKNGETFWVNFAITPVLDSSGKHTHWIAVERDVTRIKQAEQDIQKAYDDRLQYIEKIEENNKRLSEIAWIQSHIVRAPLARIMGIIEVLTQFETTPEEFRQLMANLNHSAEELDKIIRDIAAKAAETRDKRWANG